MLPLANVVGLFDAAGFWQNLATMLGAAAVYAQRRARPERDPYEELEMMIRRPVIWTMRHPLVAVRRKIDRRHGQH